MLKKLFFILFLLVFAQLHAQGEANIWHFGENAGIDFNSGAPVDLPGSQMVTNEGCASISDSNGNLLFYTDGSSVWNKNHVVMPNGTGLTGDDSSTSSAIIVPKPNDSNIYYVFALGSHTIGLEYSEVDMTLDSGLGDINSTKNIELESTSAEKLTAVKHADGNSIWVVDHAWNSNEFRAFLVTPSGINTTPIISAIGEIIDDTSETLGYLKISPNSLKIVNANKVQNFVQLFDFDNATGMLSNVITLDVDTNDLFDNAYGVEFSPNSTVLYVSDGNHIYQFDITSNNEAIINSTKITIASPAYSHSYSALQLAPDEKIYVASLNNQSLDIIDSPNTVGLGCNFLFEGFPLSGSSRLGLPTFIQSYFNVSIAYSNLCLGESTEFSLSNTVDSVTWDFGDPISGANNTSTNMTPTHIFTSVGTYTVTATAISGADIAVSTIEVVINEIPIATQPQNILYCDTDNDGFYTFNLSTQDADILNGQSNTIFDVIYYASMADYTANTPIPDKTAYTNTTAYGLQTIIASVVNTNNTNCEDSTSFTIQVFESPTPNLTISNLSFCDNTTIGTDTDGIIAFDLTLRENDILNGQSASDFTVKYYTDVAHLNEIINKTAYPNTSTPQTIYVVVENNLNTACIGQTSFVIEVFELPTVTPIVELKQCDDDIDGISIFNLEEVIDEITTNAINETITFHTSLADATLGDSPIPNTTTYSNVSANTVWARVVNANNCFKTAQVNLIVSTTQIPLTFATRNFYECDDAIDGTITDGISSFNFSSVTTEIEALFPVGQQLLITYYRNLADALAENNPITDNTNYRNIGYPNTQNIFIRVDSLLDNDCIGLGSHITLHVETIPVANPITLNDQCDDDGDGMYAFDTSTYENTIVGSQTDVTIFYTDEIGNALPSPLPNPFFTATQTITVRVENALSQDIDGACFDETSISFSVDAAAVANSVTNFIECDDDTDGEFSFDTSTIEATVLNGQTGMLVSYTDSDGNPLSSPLPNPFLTGNETITVRVENPLNTVCFDETTFEFIVRERPEFEMIDEDVICINESPILHITTFNPNDVYSYSWTGPSGFTATGISTSVSEGGIYTVIATSSFGCDSFPQEISITESELATITLDMITIVDDSINNTITINTTDLGFGAYEFSLDDEFGTYQDSPIFNNISAGIHIIYVRDKNNCGTTSIEVSVIGFPNFFTPNNDGYNDYWNVRGINNNFYTNSIIHIYDRFGKIITILDPTSDGWDGLYNGRELPATDYWFTAQLVSNDGNIRERRGHFSLIR